MGPITDEDISSPHPRKQSISGSQPPRPGQGAPTTFFLRSEEEMNNPSVMQDCQEVGTSPVTIQDSSYGVQSLEEAIGSALLGNGEGEKDGHKSTVLGKRKSIKNPVHPKIIAAAQRIISPETLKNGSPVSSSPSQTSDRRSSQISISQPLTPFRLSPTPGSRAASSPKTGSLKSFKLSDDESAADDMESQVVDSGNEDEHHNEDESRVPTEKAPQLVMPSIKMPTRRPFTEKGKRIGKMKILVAGATGVGKTSLIRSILQCCEDIVHVDPLPASQSSSQINEDKRQKSHHLRENHVSAVEFTEIYASTRAYPTWWTDMEGSRTLRRRKSMGDVVLERNVCFVDTPGYNSREGSKIDMEPTIKYIDDLLHRNATFENLTESEMLHILSGNGGIQIDLVLYLINTEGHNATDIDTLARLCPVTNVLPIVSKGDTVEPEDTISLKTKLLQDLVDADIHPFLFGRTNEECLKEPSQMPPFVISSATGRDADTMDASLLMSSEYMQPLLPSDLYSLVDQMFDPENTAWLRHSAARKFLQWRSTRDGKSMFMNRIVPPGPAGTSLEADSDSKKPCPGIPSSDIALSPTLSQDFLLNSSSRSFSPPVPTSPKGHQTALTLLGDHTQRGEQLSQVRLAKWATDLQRSLKNERERYERLARGERKDSLVERSEEYNVEAAAEKERRLVQTKGISSQRRIGRLPRRPIQDPRDPLGLLRFADRVGQKGWIVVQVLGGCGLAGALAVWIWRSWDSWIGNGGLDNWSAWSFVER